MFLRPGLSEEAGAQLRKLWSRQQCEQGGLSPRADLLPRPGTWLHGAWIPLVREFDCFEIWDKVEAAEKS